MDIKIGGFQMSVRIMRFVERNVFDGCDMPQENVVR